MTDMTCEELVNWNCPLADEILAKKCKTFCEEKDYEYDSVPLAEFNSWVPTEEELPGLIESIKYWSNVKPKGEKHNWSKLQFKLYCEASKKEKMLLNALSKISNITDCVSQHLETEKRVLLRKKLKKKISASQSCRK